MIQYVGKRLLLMIPTLLGVLLLTFTVIQFVPGGPVEQMVSELRGKGHGGQEAGGGSQSIYRRSDSGSWSRDLRPLILATASFITPRYGR
jgi:microcin C transport system permease protein